MREFLGVGKPDIRGLLLMGMGSFVGGLRAGF